MKRLYIFLLIVCLAILSNSCLLSESKRQIKDKGSYQIAFSDSLFNTYPKGGGLSVASIIPSDDFEGSIQLTVTGDKHLNSRLTHTVLTSSKTVTELIIQPDSLMALGEYTVVIEHTHNNVSNSFVIPVLIRKVINCQYCSIEEGPKPLGYDSSVEAIKEFVLWCSVNLSETGLTETNEFIVFGTNPGWIGSNGVWTAYNEKWDIRFRSVAYKYRLHWYKIRKMGEKEFFIAIRHEDDRIFEIPLEEF